MKELTRDEKGLLKGGFKEVNVEVNSNYHSKNENCDNGIEDTNTNCKCKRCDELEVELPLPEDPIEPEIPEGE